MKAYGVGYYVDTDNYIGFETEYDYVKYGSYNETKAYNALKQIANMHNCLLIIASMGEGLAFVECPDQRTLPYKKIYEIVYGIYSPNASQNRSTEDALKNIKALIEESNIMK